MKKAGSLKDFQRREWLADLATRLTALIGHLTGCGVERPRISALQQMVDATGGAGATVEWISRAKRRRVVEVP